MKKDKGYAWNTDRNKESGKMTVDALNRKAKQRMTVILILGILLILADFATSAGEKITITESYGQLYMIRPEADEEAGHITLLAEVKGDSRDYEKKINVMLKPHNSGKDTQGDKETENSMDMSEEDRIDYELRTVTDSFNSDSSEKKIRLPDSLDTGEQISWEIQETSQNNALKIIAIMMLLAAVVYKNRFAPLEKVKEENKESVIRQLPGFVNRLVLLLNAGLVLSSAFEKSVEESLEFGCKDEYFHKKMKEIYLSIKTANGSLNKELRTFARESGSRELMRISNIISDNISKGVELTQKLQNESELLWMYRKKVCEERGKLAETKLTLPLVIFLMVLILITVSPALLEL